MSRASLLEMSRGARSFTIETAWVVLAVVSIVLTPTPARSADDPQAPEITARESRNLRRLLLVNAGLDVGYMAAGSALARTKGQNDPGWRGHGIGILLQGAFLWVFDLFHASQIQNTGKTANP